MSAPTATRSRPPRRSRGAPVSPAPRSARLLGATWTAALLFAPAAHNGLWSVNALGSLAVPSRVLLVGLALVTAALPRSRPGPRGALAAGLALAGTLAFAVPETTHFLGDTSIRSAAIARFVLRTESRPLSAWAEELHAQPLDLLVNLLLPSTLVRVGFPLSVAISLVSFGLGVTFLCGAWRLVQRLQVPAETVFAATASLALAGTLLAFAGYLEWAGLLLALAVWWWADVLVPLRTRAAAARIVVLGILLTLTHRLGLALWLVIAWRAWGPALTGDEARARRTLQILTAAAGVALALALTLTPSYARLARDVRETMATLGAPGAAIRAVADGLNVLLLVAPLVLVAPILAGLEATRTAIARPRALPVVGITALLLPIAFLVPAVPTSLGGHRDWDIQAALGLAASILGLLILIQAPTARARVIWSWLLPAMALQTGAWVLANHDPSAAMARARVLVNGPVRLADAQWSQALLFLATEADLRNRPAEAAAYFERSYDLVPAANRGLRAAYDWAEAGERERARRMIERLRVRTDLDTTMRALLDHLDRQIGHASPSTPTDF